MSSRRPTVIARAALPARGPLARRRRVRPSQPALAIVGDALVPVLPRGPLVGGLAPFHATSQASGQAAQPVEDAGQVHRDEPTPAGGRMDGRWVMVNPTPGRRGAGIQCRPADTPERRPGVIASTDPRRMRRIYDATSRVTGVSGTRCVAGRRPRRGGSGSGSNGCTLNGQGPDGPDAQPRLTPTHRARYRRLVIHACSRVEGS